MADQIIADYIRETSKILIESNDELIRSGFLDIESLYKHLSSLQEEKERALQSLSLEDSAAFGRIKPEPRENVLRLHGSLDCQQNPVLCTPTGAPLK
jgi:hypothetical protein